MLMNTRSYFGKRSFKNRLYSVCNLSDENFPRRQMKSDGTHLGGLKGTLLGKCQRWTCGHLRLILYAVFLIVLFCMVKSFMIPVNHSKPFGGSAIRNLKLLKGEKRHKNADLDTVNRGRVRYDRLLTLASETKSRDGSSNLWKEPHEEASKWKPCAGNHKHAREGPHTKRGRDNRSSGYAVVSTSGGLNQQRVAVCNAVVVAVLLNASLVLPRFLYSNVWKDNRGKRNAYDGSSDAFGHVFVVSSQFGDIYQEDYFINYLKGDLNIVKELPSHLPTDFEATGSQITDTDLVKESSPIDFIKTALPLLQRNGVVHFLGFINRLGFDPLEPNLQKLRCKCNFHALKFVPKIQEVGSLLVRRIRNHDFRSTEIHKQLLGSHMPVAPVNAQNTSQGASKYLALHVRFEIDMVAYSLCDFGGGERERKELQAYREIHFPRLVEQTKNNPVSSKDLRKFGKCPLTPEEAALVLAAMGFNPKTYIYLAGSNIYGGQARMAPLAKLFPNLVRKEDLLTPSELAPFKNSYSQLAALDFIACASSDVFAMTDSGSQLSSLVSGYRVYHGRGQAPTLRPNKKVLSEILSKSRTMKWMDFVARVKDMINENQEVHERRRGQSIYRQPRSQGCMCEI